jgi:hypothetical protein
MTIVGIKFSKTHPEHPRAEGTFIEKTRVIMKVEILGKEKDGQEFSCSEQTEYAETYDEDKPLIEVLRALLSKLSPPKHLQSLTPKPKTENP